MAVFPSFRYTQTTEPSNFFLYICSFMCLEFVYKLKIKWKHNVYACLRDASNKDENITYIRERAKLEKMLSDAMGKETKKNGNDGREHQHTTLTH